MDSRKINRSDGLTLTNVYLAVMFCIQPFLFFFYFKCPDGKLKNKEGMNIAKKQSGEKDISSELYSRMFIFISNCHFVDVKYPTTHSHEFFREDISTD